MMKYNKGFSPAISNYVKRHWESGLIRLFMKV